MNFDVTGPFELKRHGAKKLITDQSIRDLEPVLEAKEPGLTEACGCYVFALRAGKGCTPHYVGQACKSSILREAMNPANREKYNKVLAEKNGMPILFLIPMRTRNGRFRRRPKSNNRLVSLDFLERWLITAAIFKNSKLINNKQTHLLRNLHVTGIFNAERGEATAASQALRKTLSLLW